MIREPKRLSEERQELGASISATRELLPSEERLTALAARLTAAGAPVEGAARRSAEFATFRAPRTPLWLTAGRKLVEPGTLAILAALVAGLALITGAVLLRKADEPVLPPPLHALESDLATGHAPSEPDATSGAIATRRGAEPGVPRAAAAASGETLAARVPGAAPSAEADRAPARSADLARDVSANPAPAGPSPTAAEQGEPIAGPRTREFPRPTPGDTGASLSDGTVLETEIELLKQARSALAPDPLQAFALTERCRGQYPNGAFAQEREYIAIAALARLGRTSDAQARASLFRRRYPSSAYLPRLERLLGEE
jgi:hypothetical protein